MRSVCRHCRLVRWKRLSGPALVALLVAPAPVWAWGERAHQLVNAAAVENLPGRLRAYFRARKAFLVEHAIDLDRVAKEKPAERPHHYTEVEAYDPYPFNGFKQQFVDERRGPSPLQLKHGDLLWQIERFTLRLAAALRQRRWEEADRTALFAAHYACDLTQPLHTVLNYDGQLTNQAGLHARFETELVKARGSQWALKPEPALAEADLRVRIFSEMLESYSQRNLIFASDRIAVAGHTYVDPQYFSTFLELAGPVARKRLEAAVSFVSTLWYTAWVRASKPALP